MDELLLCGWLGVDAAVNEMDRLAGEFPEFNVVGATERKRTCAWDAWDSIGWNINRSTLYRQEVGDCVSFGAAIAVAAVAAHEIVRLNQPERFEVPFPPYLYGISRVMPEGGNGRLNGDGSLGSWMAATIKRYGVLRESFPGVPEYSGRVARSWGSSQRSFDEFLPEGSKHLIREAAPIRDAESAIDAICNGYYCTIASNKGYSNRLQDRNGKSWFVGSAVWPHQMSLIAYDDDPEPCFYRRNQWGSAHGSQLDGPDGGGWVTAEEIDRELRRGGTECFAFSMFDGFPSESNKPRNYFA